MKRLLTRWGLAILGICVILSLVGVYLSKARYVTPGVTRTAVAKPSLQPLKSKCTTPRKCRFLKPPGPRTALVSFPGSGNTWTRYLIEQMTGFYTGSVYNDGRLREGGFLGESIRNGTVVAVKTHKNTTFRFERAILLVRNPYHAMLSHYNLRISSKHTGHVDIDKHRTNWVKYVERFIQKSKLRRLYLPWLQVPDIVLLCYENMVEDLKTQLIRIQNFYSKVKITVDIRCVLKNSEGDFHRSQSDTKKRLGSFYNTTQRKRINSIISSLQQEFSKRFPKEEICNMSSWMLA